MASFGTFDEVMVADETPAQTICYSGPVVYIPLCVDCYVDLLIRGLPYPRSRTTAVDGFTKGSMFDLNIASSFTYHGVRVHW